MRPSPPFRGNSGPPNRGWHSGPPRPFRHSPQGGSFHGPRSPYGPLPSFQSPPDFRHRGGANYNSPRHGTPPGDFRQGGANYNSPRHGTPPGDFRQGGLNYNSPRHSTPVSRGGSRFEPPGTPFRTPPSRISNVTPRSYSETNSASFVTANDATGSSFGSGRKSGPRHQDSAGNKRRRTESTFPGTLLKPSMLEDPWLHAVPVKRPEDGLVLSGGQRHSFLTPKKAAATELEQPEEEEGEADLN